MEKSVKEDKKASLHVSFSNSVDELGVGKNNGSIGDIDSSGKFWGSWNKKRTSLQVPTIPEDPDGSSSAPSIHSFDDGKRKEKHKSFAPQYLRSLMSGSNESMSEGSHVTLRRSNSLSGHPTTSRSSESNNVHLDTTSSQPTKKRFSPLLVGSPTLPKARLESETDVERVNSLRTPGKWANRNRILSVDLSRMRTIHAAHPLFSFERPGSAGATSRDEKIGLDEELESSDVKKQRRATMPAKPIRSLVSGSNSGQVIADGPQRSDPGVPHSKGRLLRPLLGAQTLGRFDFEASTSTSILPRRAERGSRLSTPISPIKSLTSTTRLSKLGISGSNNAVSSTKSESCDDKRFHEYTEFCKDLRIMLGDDDWSSFMNCKHLLL